MTVQGDVQEGTDELMACCGQFLARDRGQEHSLFDGKKDLYQIGGLAIEMEGCFENDMNNMNNRHGEQVRTGVSYMY